MIFLNLWLNCNMFTHTHTHTHRQNSEFKIDWWWLRVREPQKERARERLSQREMSSGCCFSCYGSYCNAKLHLLYRAMREIFLPTANRPDMTFAVDWALSNNNQSINPTANTFYCYDTGCQQPLVIKKLSCVRDKPKSNHVRCGVLEGDWVLT